MGVRNRSAVYVKFLAYLTVIILINLAGVTLFFRADLTANKRYSLSDASRRVVSTLSEPLTLNVFFTKNLPAPHNNTERYLRDLLEEYAAYANEYFNYRFYDVSAEEGDIGQEATTNQDLARSYGIHPVQIQVIEKDEVKFQKAYMGLVLIHGDIMERIPTITSTDGLEYELTTAIQKLNNKISALLRLPEKIRITLFLSSSLKIVAPHMRLNELPEIPARLEKIVERVNDKHYGKLEFEYLDPSKEENLAAKLEQYNVLQVKWPALAGGKIQPGEGAIGLVMAYGDKVVDIPLIHVMRLPLIGKHYELVDMNKMEEIINEAVESLIDINEDLGYLASHGTADLSGRSPMDPMRLNKEESLMNFQTLTSENYTIRHVNMKDEGIPDGLGCLVIAGPTESFTNYELFQIDQFLMRGKSLALFLDVFKEEVPQQELRMRRGPMYVPLKTGLEKLLDHYGVRMKKSYVMDENCYRQMLPARFGGGERTLYFAPIIKNEFINNDLGFMGNIKGLVAMKMSPLELNMERTKELGLNARKVFSSSEKSWEMKGRINLNPLFIRPPQSGDEQESFPLAYVLEGEFPSYFAGKPIPDKIAEDEDAETEEQSKEADRKKSDVDLSKFEAEGEFLSRGKEGKIFVMASSHMLKDNLLDERGRTPNAMFIMNVLDFLNEREDIAQMRSKEQRLNPLEETGAGTKTFVKSFNIAGMPVLVILFGIGVWFRRVSKKRRIQMMFHK